MSGNMASSLLGNDSSWFTRSAASTPYGSPDSSTTTGTGSSARTSGAATAASNGINPKLAAIQQTTAGVVKPDVFSAANMVSLANVNPHSEPLVKNNKVANQTEAIKYKCVANTAKILDQTGTGNIKSPSSDNHTMSAINDLFDEGWRAVKDADPGNAPPGSFVASFDSSRASANTPYGSDSAIVAMADNGDKYLGGRPGSEGSYKVDKSNPHASVYGDRGKSFVMVPPGSVTMA